MSDRAVMCWVRFCAAVALAAVAIVIDASPSRAGACAFPTGDRRRIVWAGDDSGLLYIKGRGIEWMKLDGSATSTVVEVPGPGALDFDLSPDGSMLAYTQPGRIGADCAGVEPEIRTLRLADRVAGRRLKEPKGHFTSVRFSPDGRYLAANLKDFGTKPTSQVLIYDDSLNFIGRFDDWGGIVWRGDGRQLGIVSWNLISVWDSRAWEQIKSLRRPSGRIGPVTWSSNGAWLAVWVESEKGCDVDASTSELVIFDATTWTVFKTIPQPGRCALELTWNPKVDAPVLAAFVREPLPKGAPANSRPSHRIAVWNTRSWEEVGGSPTGQDRASDLVWSHSGERIAVGFDDVLVFELGDLGSPPGASNEPRSITDDVLPGSIAPPTETPSTAPSAAPAAPTVAPPPAPRATAPAAPRASGTSKGGKTYKP